MNIKNNLISAAILINLLFSLNPQINNELPVSKYINPENYISVDSLLNFEDIGYEIEDNIENIKDDSSITNTADSEISKSIVKYTESELKRAEAYFNRNWKPDHTINIAAWDYISRMAIIEDEKVLKEIFDMKENQVVNALK